MIIQIIHLAFQCNNSKNRVKSNNHDFSYSTLQKKALSRSSFHWISKGYNQRGIPRYVSTCNQNKKSISNKSNSKYYKHDNLGLTPVHKFIGLVL